MLIRENRWRAQRYGGTQGLIDFGLGKIIPYAELIEELITLTAEDQQHLKCEQEVTHARQILKRGTSAENQLHHYHQAKNNGATEEEALHAVVDWLIRETHV